MTPASAQRRLAELSADAGVHRAFRWLHLNELQLRRWQMEFLRIPAPPFGEADRARWFCERFRELGLADVHLDAEGNAVALHRPAAATPLTGTAAAASPGMPGILLTAHLDTVFPADTCLDLLEDGSRILCPGACDNGAGLAALLGIAAALQAAELRAACPVLFAANVGEEGEGDLRGMRHLLQARPYALAPAGVIALEGSGNSLVVDRALGSRRLRVSVRGPGGHSWADARHPNPILALSSALVALARLPLSAQPRTTLNVGTIHGGTSVNSVPQTATALLDLRSTATLELDRLEVAVLATISAEIAAWPGTGVRAPGSASDGGRLELRIERIGERPVGALDGDAPLYRSLRAVDRHLGIVTEPRLGSTDANLPLSLGIPALAIGAGGAGGHLHSTSEWYDPHGRELALRRILLLLLDAANHVQAQEGLATLATCPPFSV